ncbi:MAG: hypothetical protein WAV51_00295 [Microgenomates group bacterium]
MARTPEQQAEARKNFIFLLVGFIALTIAAMNVYGAILAFGNTASDLPARIQHANAITIIVFLSVSILASGFYFFWKGFHLGGAINRTAYFVGSGVVMSVMWNIAALMLSIVLTGTPVVYTILGIAFIGDAIIGVFVYFFRKY